MYKNKIKLEMEENGKNINGRKGEKRRKKEKISDKTRNWEKKKTKNKEYIKLENVFSKGGRNPYFALIQVFLGLRSQPWTLL